MSQQHFWASQVHEEQFQALDTISGFKALIVISFEDKCCGMI